MSISSKPVDAGSYQEMCAGCPGGAEQLIDNARAVLLSILRAKPASAKGNYVKGVTVATTMGPGIKIDLSQVRAMAA